MGPYNVEPGLCVIISNTNFKHEIDLPGEEDELDLFKLFFSLRFEVKIHRNLTANEMVHKLESYSKFQHTGAFFLIILSHGTMDRGKEAILGTDSKTVMMDDIESFFHATRCPTLCEIPKIFLIDACRGNQQERVYSERQSHDTSRSVPKSAGQNLSDKRVSILDTSDFLLVYASTRGHKAYADTKYGSKLTRTFIEVTNEVVNDTKKAVTKEASTKKTISDIIREVKRRVQDDGKQTVESVDRLTQQYSITRYITLLQLCYM